MSVRGLGLPDNRYRRGRAEGGGDAGSTTERSSGSWSGVDGRNQPDHGPDFMLGRGGMTGMSIVVCRSRWQTANDLFGRCLPGHRHACPPIFGILAFGALIDYPPTPPFVVHSGTNHFFRQSFTAIPINLCRALHARSTTRRGLRVFLTVCGAPAQNRAAGRGECRPACPSCGPAPR